jgi:PAS domain-containing protein
VTSAGANTEHLDAALLKTILEVATEGIVFIDGSNTIAYINQVGREILRCTRRDDPLPTFHEVVWGMVSYPKDVGSAQEMVATAVKSASGSKARVIDPQQ